jgi:hypothetical protein
MFPGLAPLLESPSDPSPEAGFARREAHRPRNAGTTNRAAGSAYARVTLPSRKEGAHGETRGFPVLRTVALLELLA